MSLCIHKRAALSHLAAVAKAMANENRICLLVHLARCEQSVKALAECSGFSIAKTSKLLKQLRLAGLISLRRDGASQVYQLSDSRILTILDAAYKIVERDFEETENLLLSYLRRSKKPLPVSCGDFAP